MTTSTNAQPEIFSAPPNAKPAPLRHTHLDALAIVLMLGCCLAWGLQQVVVKWALPEIPPLAQAAMRSVGAAAALALWARWRGIALIVRSDLRDRLFWPGIASGVLFALEFFAAYSALPLTNASRVVVFIYLAPFIVAAVLPFLIPSERMSLLQLTGLCAAFAAVAFAFQEGLVLPTHTQLLGDALAITGAVFWAMTTLLVCATRLAQASAEKTLFYQLLVSAPLLVAASCLSGEHFFVWSRIAGLSLPAWLAMAYQIFVISFASYLIWFWLLTRYPATRISTYSFFTPMFGLLFGALLLGEHLSSRLLVAMAFVTLGTWLVNRKKSA